MKNPIFLALIAIFLLSLIACDDKGKDDPKPQFKTITFGANLSTNVTGHMTNSQWDNVIGKLTTALNSAANAGGELGEDTAGLFGANYHGSIDLVKTTASNYYKSEFNNPVYKISLNADYVIGATQADLSAKVALAINGAAGNGATQQ